MLKKLQHFLFLFLSPIIQELPFFCMYFFLMNHFMFRRIYGKITLPEEYINTSYWSIYASMCIVFMAAYFFSLIIASCHKTWVRALAYCLCLVLFSVDIFLVERFDMAISPTMLILMAETNQQESSEFVQTFLSIGDNKVVYSTILLSVICVIIFERTYRPKILPWIKRTCRHWKWMRLTVSLVAIFMLCTGLLSLGRFFRMFQCEDTDALTLWTNESPCDPLSNTIYAFYGIHLTKEEIKKAVEINQHLNNGVACHEDSLCVVFVIGESYIRQHAQIYGYELNTTPIMKKEKENGNLFVFSDVCTPFNQTSLVMKNIMSCNSISEDEPWHASPFMPGIFSKAGYNVLYWDNQKDNGSVFEFTLNKYIYNEKMISFYSDMNEKSVGYDGDLIDSFKARKNNRDGTKLLVMFHLWGQHFEFEQRYPQMPTFMRFTEDSIKRNDEYLTSDKKRRIAYYDNATFYNDYVIGQIIDYFKEKNAVMVYLSDHGEEVYDYRDNVGRRSGGMNKKILEYQYSVPFVIWCSPLYQERHPETINAIRDAVDRPFMIDNVCQVLFHLSGIETSYYKPERDLLSDKYKKPKRIVNKNIDYDQIARQ